MDAVQKDTEQKHYIAIKSLYEALKIYKKETKKNYIDVLKEFGYEFKFVRQRESLMSIIAHGFMVIVQNNFGYDASSYESSCPKNLDEWYYEIARLSGDDPERISSDAIDIIKNCCFLDPEMITIDTPFANMIEGLFNIDLALNLFILDNLDYSHDENLKNNLSSLIIELIDNKLISL